MPHKIPAIVIEVHCLASECPDIIVGPCGIREEGIPVGGLKGDLKTGGLKAIQNPVQIHGQNIVIGAVFCMTVNKIHHMITYKGESLSAALNRIGLSI
jgi:hypothetical protein